MPMNCNQTKQHIQPYVDETLNQDLITKVIAHLNVCPACTREVTSLRELLASLKESSCPKVSDTQWRAMHDAVMAALINTKQTKLQLHTPTASVLHHRFAFSRIQSIAALLVISLVSSLLFFSIGSGSHTIASLFRKAQYPTIVSLTGTVLTSENSSNQNPVSNDFSILPGKGISTDSTSSVEIRVDAKSVLSLGRSSQCNVKDFVKNRAVFALSRGGLNAQVSKRTRDQLFRIETPNAFCEVIGTKFDINAQKDPFSHTPVTTLVVHEGTVKFGTKRHAVFVKAGRALAIFGDSLSAEFSANDPLIEHLNSSPGKGRITATTEPSGAQVYINSVLYGTTPLEVVVPCGEYAIQFTKPDHTPWGSTISVNTYTPISCSATLISKNRPVATVAKSALPVSDSPFEHPALTAALALMNSGRYAEAINSLLILTNNTSIAASLRAIAYQKLSTCYQNSGNSAKALQMLTNVINGNFPTTNKATALFERGTLYRTSQHNPALAIDDFEMYCTHYPKGIWVEESMLSLAQLLQVSGSYAKAAETYQKFCVSYSTNPNYDKALYSLATIYSSSFVDLVKANAAYSQLLREKPTSEYAEDAAFWSADCLLKLGHVDKALSAYRTYLSRYPKGTWAKEAGVRLHKIETAEAH